jgi:hypothetical protein
MTEKEISKFLMKQNKEMVNHPDHYGGKDNPYEVIKVLEAWNHLSFHLSNTIKYIARADFKVSKIEDLNKAKWYLLREIVNTMKEMGKNCKYFNIGGNCTASEPNLPCVMLNSDYIDKYMERNEVCEDYERKSKD